MAVRPQHVSWESVSLLLHHARAALQQSNYVLASQFLTAAARRDQTPESIFLAGRSAQFQGDFGTALKHFQHSWEIAKTQQNLQFRWKSCLAMAQCQAVLQQPCLVEQSQQLAIAAACEELVTGERAELPVEIQICVAQSEIRQKQFWSALERLRTLHAEVTHANVVEPDLTAQIESSLAKIHSGRHRLAWLQKSARSFQQAGNLFGCMQIMEEMAAERLSLRDWEQGQRVLAESQKLAIRLNLPAKILEYRKLSGRLRNSLGLLNGHSLSN